MKFAAKYDVKSLAFSFLASPLGFIGAVFFVSRVLLIIVSFLAWQLPVLFPAFIHQGTLAQMWDHWDATYYLGISRDGYQPASSHESPAFFPLYPLFIHITTVLLSGGTSYRLDGNAFYASILVTNSSWFGALYFLYRLAKDDFGKPVAQLAVVLISVFPSAFFTMLPYPESLFLLFAISSFWCIRRGWWGWAAGLGFLAALTRQSAVLLIIPFLWEYSIQKQLIQIQQRPRISPENNHNVLQRMLAHIPAITIRWPQFFQRLDHTVLFALAFPASVVCYGLLLWRSVGDPLAFLHAQAHWHRVTYFPLQMYWLGFQGILEEKGPFGITRALVEFLSVVLMGFVCFMSWLRAIHIPMSYILLGTVTYGFFLSSSAGWILTSESRYMLEIFPFFIIFADMLKRHWQITLTYIIASLPIQLLLMAWFSMGYWVV